MLVVSVSVAVAITCRSLQHVPPALTKTSLPSGETATPLGLIVPGEPTDVVELTVFVAVLITDTLAPPLLAT